MSEPLKVALMTHGPAVCAAAVEVDQLHVQPVPRVNAGLARNQGEFVLSRNLKLVKEVARVLDISLVILYNRLHQH